MQDLQMLQDAARTKKMAKLLRDATKQTRTRKCKTFKCCKMLLEDGEARMATKRTLTHRWTTFKCCTMLLEDEGDETRHHYPRPPCAPSFVKSRIFRPLQTHFLLFQQIFFVLVCIHAGTPRVPPRVLASAPKPCGGKNSFKTWKRSAILFMRYALLVHKRQRIDWSCTQAKFNLEKQWAYRHFRSLDWANWNRSMKQDTPDY